MDQRPRQRWFKSLQVVGAIALLLCSAAKAEDSAPRAARPVGGSDGPTLYWQHKVASQGPQSPKEMLRRSRLRLKALQWGENKTIPINQELRQTLAGAVVELGRLTSSSSKGSYYTRTRDLKREALASKDRVHTLLTRAGITTDDQRSRLAEMMVWRGLAYNSSTLAHGSFGPQDGGNQELQQKARDGLSASIGHSFKLGRRLHGAVTRRNGRFLRWDDIRELQAIAIKDFPEKEPGEVRHVNFAWPMNSFGVHHPRLHGNGGEVHKLWAQLERDRGGAFAQSPLTFMGRTLYWLHNIHPFRDGNGRTEVLLNWTLAQAAGFPLPLEYDQGSGKFKLAATKWGGTRNDLTRFVARGALGTERFVKALLPVLGGDRIVSSHTDHGAVSMVTRSRTGREHLVVMFPVTHARSSDADLRSEQNRNRLVVCGERFDPSRIKVRVAIDGKHNPWQTVSATAVHKWDQRYPWWSTAEPMFKIPLPRGAALADFHVLGPDGQRVGPENFYMNLRDYQDIGARTGGQQ